MADLKKEVEELKFKLKTLSNFIYNHHHTIDISNDEYVDTKETNKPKVWVHYEDGWKEEGASDEK